LATVRRLVQGCGGSVGVRSIVGVGSCFRVELPKAGAGCVGELADAHAH
jgi:signal transduction histidine kinase